MIYRTISSDPKCIKFENPKKKVKIEEEKKFLRK